MWDARHITGGDVGMSGKYTQDYTTCTSKQSEDEQRLVALSRCLEGCFHAPRAGGAPLR
jgi:hypothetical protein